MLIRREVAGIAGAAALADGSGARARSAVPSRNIRLVVGYPAGGDVGGVSRPMTLRERRVFVRSETEELGGIAGAARIRAG